ncbi:unnamed protein product [Clavelina lepadiformis]|uniref:asparagine--tRNA ligase n=1 Tax=Clavelina lepadiformis TaxID=159417 RepID=A0ABP0EWI1_CLALP
MEISEELYSSGAKCIKIYQSKQNRDERVKVSGWVHCIKKREKDLMIFVLRDGTGYLQVVVDDKLCEIGNNFLLTPESTVTLYGLIRKVPEIKSTLDSHELICDYLKLIGLAPAGGIDFISNNKESKLLSDNRHLVIRREKTSKILKVRSYLLQVIRDHYFERKYHEVNPPSIITYKMEEADNMFKVDFFGEPMYLTPSSQFYLEISLPTLGNVFCVAESFRREETKSRRHLAEYTHVEAECAFITFNDLLNNLEELICDIVDKVMKSPAGPLIKDLNPNFTPPKRPFRQIDYAEAIIYLKEHDIKKEDGSYFEFGEDIPEMAERKMTDQMKEPIFLCRFPASIKMFHMKRCPENEKLTQSVDLLLPNVGEVIGASMRRDNYDELLEAFHQDGLDTSLYYWYTDQRKFGTCPHGGYGLGLERLLTWLCNWHHIKDVCLCPRLVGSFQP